MEKRTILSILRKAHVRQVGGCGEPVCVYMHLQLLAELLRSKNPEDLQEANRLIKSMVKEVCNPSSVT